MVSDKTSWKDIMSQYYDIFIDSYKMWWQKEKNSNQDTFNLCMSQKVSAYY